MEEKDVQIRGYRVRLPLDLFVIASANPEDYTSRGRIITPLKDRFGSQVRTHYPLTTGEEMQIMESERNPVPEDFELIFPGFMKEIVAELTHLARRSPHISQSSGVSVRMSIANFENLASNSVRLLDGGARRDRSARRGQGGAGSFAPRARGGQRGVQPLLLRLSFRRARIAVRGRNDARGRRGHLGSRIHARDR